MAGFYDPARRACGLGLRHATARPDGGMDLTLDACAGGGTMAAARNGAGRFQPAKGEVWWVLWVDEEYRTAVIGTPSGAFGAVINRTASIKPDRLRAAREVLDFNGYDVSRLIPPR